MILSALLAGFIAGRWFIVPLVAAAWVAVLLAVGSSCDAGCLIGESIRAAAISAVGVIVHKLARRGLTWERRRRV